MAWMNGPIRIEDAAYAAGFFDGEGCIRMEGRHGRGGQRFFLAVSITQNDRTPLDWIKDRFGGSVRLCQSRRSYDGVETTLWIYVISTAAALRFLQTIRPFLIVKASQADLAFEFQKTMGRRGVKTSDEILTARADMAAQMKALKRQGVR